MESQHKISFDKNFVFVAVLLFIMGDLAKGSTYSTFRAWVPKNSIPVGALSPRTWTYFDSGPMDYPEPLICLHGATGAADVFFSQCLELGQKGYRVLSIELPTYPTPEEFCESFSLFLEMLGIKKIHLYGTGLGGYLAILFTQEDRMERVLSLALTRAFTNTKIIQHNGGSGGGGDGRGGGWVKYPPQVVPVLPEFVLRGIFLSLLPKGQVDIHIALAVEFLIEKINQASQKQLASRLLLMMSTTNFLSRNSKKPQEEKETSTTTATTKIITQEFISDEKITIIDTLDRQTPTSIQMQDNLRQCFPDAKLALLKEGGEYPYLSRAEQVSMHLLVHMRRNATTPTNLPPAPDPVLPISYNPEAMRRKRAQEAAERERKRKELKEKMKESGASTDTKDSDHAAPESDGQNDSENPAQNYFLKQYSLAKDELSDPDRFTSYMDPGYHNVPIKKEEEVSQPVQASTSPDIDYLNFDTLKMTRSLNEAGKDNDNKTFEIMSLESENESKSDTKQNRLNKTRDKDDYDYSERLREWITSPYTAAEK